MNWPNANCSKWLRGEFPYDSPAIMRDLIFPSDLGFVFFSCVEQYNIIARVRAVPIDRAIWGLFPVPQETIVGISAKRGGRKIRVMSKSCRFFGSVKFCEIVSLLGEMNVPRRRAVHAETHTRRIESMFSFDRDGASRGRTSRTWPRSLDEFFLILGGRLPIIAGETDDKLIIQRSNWRRCKKIESFYFIQQWVYWKIDCFPLAFDINW